MMLTLACHSPRKLAGVMLKVITSSFSTLTAEWHVQLYQYLSLQVSLSYVGIRRVKVAVSSDGTGTTFYNLLS